MNAPRKGSLFAIFLTVFIDLLGFGIVLPLLPLYAKQFAQDLNWSSGQVGLVIGLLMASFSAMQFLVMPVWGRLSDRIGRRPVLLVGLAASTIFYGLFGVATTMHSLLLMFVARIGAGIAGATIGTAQAYIADCTSNQNRAKGMALIGAAFALGFTLGPSLGVVALLFGDRADLSPWPGFLAAILSGGAFLLAYFVLPESLTAEARGASAASNRRLLDLNALRSALATPTVGLLLVASFVAVFSFSLFEGTLSLLIDALITTTNEARDTVGEAVGEVAGEVAAKRGLLTTILNWAQRRGYTEFSDQKLIVVFAVFGYLGVTLTLAQGFLVRRLAGKLSEAAMAIGGGGMAIVGFLLLGMAARNHDFHLLLGAMAIEVTGFAFVNPALQSLISRRSSPEQQGGILGLGQSAASLSRILGPAVGAPLLTMQPATPYFMAAGLMIVGLLMVAIAARSGKDYESAPQPPPPGV